MSQARNERHGLDQEIEFILAFDQQKNLILQGDLFFLEAVNSVAHGQRTSHPLSRALSSSSREMRTGMTLSPWRSRRCSTRASGSSAKAAQAAARASTLWVVAKTCSFWSRLASRKKRH